MIIALRFHGSQLPALPLPETRRIFAIGTAEGCDIVIPAELAIDVAPMHATIERVDGGIMVRETGRAHALYRSPRSPRVAELMLHAGASGWIGGCQIIALDHRLAALRSRFAVALGLDDHAAVDEAIGAVVDGAPIALIGPQNLDALGLARAVHAASAWPFRPFTQCADAAVPPLDGLDGTIAVDLDRVRRLASGRAAAMFAPRCPFRVIFLAGRARTLGRHLDTYATRVRVFELVPLAHRGEEVGRLLQAVWTDELGSDQRVETLGPRSLRALAAFDWRGLEELRAMAVRLLAYAEHQSLRRAANALGIRHQSLQQHFQRIGVEIADREERDPAPAPSRPRSTES